MKVYLFIAIIILVQFTHQNIQAQPYVTVNKIELTQAPSPASSYIVNTYGKLLPPFQFKPTAGASSFFLRANPSTVPSPDKNFVRVETLKMTATTENQAAAIPIDKKNIIYEYFDGVGRSVQKVAVRNSPSQKDLISYSTFDQFGRQPVQNLPYTFAGNGAFRLNTNDKEQRDFYSVPQTGLVVDSEPFSVNDFSTSIVKVYGPGADWHSTNSNKYSASQLNVNSANEVLQWNYTGTGLPTQSGYHPPNSLTIAQTINEENHINKVYSNFKGQKILDRTGDGTIWHDTYYVYDYYGNLSFVFPPEAIAKLGDFASQQQTFLDKWTFQYQYDLYQRLTAKRVPGSDWVYMLYDRWDRVALTQDGNLRASSKWIFTKYDRFNRPILTGFATGTKASMETGLNSSVRFEYLPASSSDYTNSVFPSHSEASLLTITYYDDYSFTWPGLAFTPEAGIVSTSDLISTTKVKGQITGTKVKNLTTNTWLKTVSFYDKKYNVVQTISENHLGGTDRVSQLYDEFTNNLKVALRTHTSSTGALTVRETYDYDHANRLLTAKHKINSSPEVLMVSNTYDELGQLIEKNIHSTDNGASFLQSVDTRYNIRGWVSNINNGTLTNDGITNNDATDLFGMDILYNQSEKIDKGETPSANIDTKKMYDGNISAIRWKTDTKVGTPQERVYGFEYDNFSRFKKSYYATKNGALWNGNAGYYNESVAYYDKNGNIGGGGATTASLGRNGLSSGSKTQIDNLVYRYEGNKLLNVQDVANNAMGFRDKGSPPVNEFGYDNNGNVKEDQNKLITNIIYNYLDRPSEIVITRVDLDADPDVDRIDKIKYTYDAVGNKLSKQVEEGSQVVWKTDYVGSIQYDQAGSGTSKISFVSTGEGRVVNTGSGYDYEYFLKDHQNNVRVVFGSLKETVSYKATMEQVSLDLKSYEDATFQNVPERVIPVDNTSLNYTAPSEKTLSPARSAKVNANAGQPVGPAKSLQVLNGDVVYMEAYAKYLLPTGNSAAITAAVLGAAVNNAFEVPPGESPLRNAINNNAGPAAAFIPAGTAQPKAYLIYLFFDNNLTFQGSGAIAVTTDAYGNWQKLSRSFTANKDGILLIYLASESNVSTADVYFDDFYIVHQKNNTALQVLQASDYYPYGLSFNEYQADRLQSVGSGNYEPILRNRYRFQEQELQKDLDPDLGWYHYKYRMHDPAIGRFGGVDPLAEKYMYNSTYAFSENRLIDGVELEGAEFAGIGAAAGFLTSYAPYVEQNSDNWDGGWLTGFGDYFSDGINNRFNTYSGFFSGRVDYEIEDYNYSNNKGVYSEEIGMDDFNKSVLHSTNQTSNFATSMAGFNAMLGDATNSMAFLMGMENSGLSMLEGGLRYSPRIGLGYRAIHPEYAEANSLAFYRSGAAGRLGNDGIYINSTIDGAMAEFKFHNPSINPVIFEAKYMMGSSLEINSSNYFGYSLPFTHDVNILTAPSLRAPGTTNFMVRQGIWPGKVVWP